MKTEREKMLAGELYDASDPELDGMRKEAHRLMAIINTPSTNADERAAAFAGLLGSCKTPPEIVPPFYCDYGKHIHLGTRVYFNFDCVVLDVCEVRIGDNVLFGPGTHIYAATHPLEWRIRAQWLESGKPVTIGSDVWVGGGAIICPGVTIGEKSVIGAGSVVTRDVPSSVFAAGNPCRPIRALD